jgi:hypothetical protein
MAFRKSFGLENVKEIRREEGRGTNISRIRDVEKVRYPYPL